MRGQISKMARFRLGRLAEKPAPKAIFWTKPPRSARNPGKSPKKSSNIKKHVKKGTIKILIKSKSMKIKHLICLNPHLLFYITFFGRYSFRLPCKSSKRKKSVYCICSCYCIFYFIIFFFLFFYFYYFSFFCFFFLVFFFFLSFFYFFFFSFFSCFF